jgi:hypothetical protein
LRISEREYLRGAYLKGTNKREKFQRNEQVRAEKLTFMPNSSFSDY